MTNLGRDEAPQLAGGRVELGQLEDLERALEQQAEHVLQRAVAHVGEALDGELDHLVEARVCAQRRQDD